MSKPKSYTMYLMLSDNARTSPLGPELVGSVLIVSGEIRGFTPNMFAEEIARQIQEIIALPREGEQ